MRIVSVMTTESAGGAEFAAVEMLDALAERGHDVMLLGSPHIGRSDRVPIEPMNIGPKLSRSTWRRLLLGSLANRRTLCQALRRQSPYDVLLVHYKKEQLLASTLPRDLRRALVWAEWGPVPFQLRRGLPRLAYTAAARRARLVLAVSEQTRASVISVGVPEGKIAVVPNVFDVDSIRYSEAGRAGVRARLLIPESAFVVGCISRLHPKKRNDVVIEAMKLLDDGRVHLIVVGEGETEAALRAQAASLGERAHFVPDRAEEISDLLSAFDVSVFCPSPSEGAPRAVILAMLAARPCLATGPEGVVDLIQPDFGEITERINDPHALANALRPYIEDPNLRRRKGYAARAWAERRFGRHVVAAEIEARLDLARTGP
jgi:glycosyltransferase involved in cell wall biosynthesis